MTRSDDPISLGVLFAGDAEFSTYKPSPAVERKVEREQARHGLRQEAPRTQAGPSPAPPPPREARSLDQRIADAQNALYGSTPADVAERVRQEMKGRR